MARCWVDYDEVRQLVRIREAMEVLGVPLNDFREGAGGELQGPCPLPCHPVGDPNHRNPRQFRVDHKNGNDVFHCFAKDHDVGGSVVHFVALMLQRDLANVRFFLADYFGDRFSAKPPGHKKSSAKPTKRTCEDEAAKQASPQATITSSVIVPSETARDDGGNGNAITAKAEQTLGGEAETAEPTPLQPMDHFLKLHRPVPYLEQRGIRAEVIERFGVGLASRGTMRGYACLPVFGHPHPNDVANPLVYLGRLAEESDADDRPKYKWGQKGFPKTRVVVGLREAMRDADDRRRLIVVEGFVDMLAAVQTGFANTVCIVGSDMSVEQAQLLTQTGKHIVLAFDGDGAGGAGGADGTGKLLAQGCRYISTIRLPEGEDPASLPPNRLRELLSFR